METIKGILNNSLIVKSESKSLQSKSFQWVKVPGTHWCGNYFRPFTEEVIADGEDCCWRHWVGLPTRWGVRHPYYPWQDRLIAQFFTNDYFAIEKTPKIGATEMYLNLALHQAAYNPAWRDGQVAIVVGTTGLNEGEKMIARCKASLEVRDKQGYGTGKYRIPVNQDYNTKKEFSLQSVEFRAHPANNIDSIRSQTNMRMIIIDEAAFFTKLDQQSVREAVEHYIGSSNLKIVWVSTAGDVPQGAFYNIMHEPNSMYIRHRLEYSEGLIVHPQSKTSLYNAEAIEKLKSSPTFGRNFLHIWGHGSGDIFDVADIEACTQEYKITAGEGRSVLNLDPAFGSSNYGIVSMVKKSGIIYVLEAYELEQPSSQYAHQHIMGIASQYNSVTVDGHWSGVVRDLEERRIRVEGINYAEQLQNMIERSAQQVKQHKVRIHPRFTKLLEQLRSAKRDKKGVVDKKIMNFDLGDAFMQGIFKLIDDGVGSAYQAPDD